MGDYVFFAASDGTTWEELWISDGTQEGTLMLKDVRESGGGGLYDTEMLPINGSLFFRAKLDDSTGQELWRHYVE